VRRGRSLSERSETKRGAPVVERAERNVVRRPLSERSETKRPRGQQRRIRQVPRGTA
jgi:hypothetical protein